MKTIVRKPSFCIICYRKCDFRHRGENESDVKQVPLLFFKLLERFLAPVSGKNETVATNEERSTRKSKMKPFQLFQLLIKMEEDFSLDLIQSCQDCSIILRSFCDLYHELKKIQLLLNWRLDTLVSIMRGARKVKSRLKSYQASLEQKLDSELARHPTAGKGGVPMKTILSFKVELEKSCSRKLSSAFPKARLTKWKSSPQEVKEDTSMPDYHAKCVTYHPSGEGETSSAHSPAPSPTSQIAVTGSRKVNESGLAGYENDTESEAEIHASQTDQNEGPVAATEVLDVNVRSKDTNPDHHHHSNLSPNVSNEPHTFAAVVSLGSDSHLKDADSQNGAESIGSLLLFDIIPDSNTEESSKKEAKKEIESEKAISSPISIEAFDAETSKHADETSMSGRNLAVEGTSNENNDINEIEGQVDRLLDPNSEMKQVTMPLPGKAIGTLTPPPPFPVNLNLESEPESRSENCHTIPLGTQSHSSCPPLVEISGDTQGPCTTTSQTCQDIIKTESNDSIQPGKKENRRIQKCFGESDIEDEDNFGASETTDTSDTDDVDYSDREEEQKLPSYLASCPNETQRSPDETKRPKLEADGKNLPIYPRRLRSHHRCPNCSKTFSTPDAFFHHENSCKLEPWEEETPTYSKANRPGSQKQKIDQDPNLEEDDRSSSSSDSDDHDTEGTASGSEANERDKPTKIKQWVPQRKASLVSPTYKFACSEPNCEQMFGGVFDFYLHRKSTHQHQHQPTTSVPLSASRTEEDPAKPQAFHLNIYESYPDINDDEKLFAKVELPEGFSLCKCEEETCDLTFDSKEKMEAHSKLHGDFPCKFCPEVKTYAEDLAFHESQEHARKTKRTPKQKQTRGWQCSRCPMRSFKQLQFVQHFVKAHLDIEHVASNMCFICGHDLEQLQGNLLYHLVNHLRSHHNLLDIPNNELKRCDWYAGKCSAYFRTAAQLKRHKKTLNHYQFGVGVVLGEFKCAKCQLSFRSSKEHLRHIRISHEKNFLQCSTKGCNFRCASKEELQSHRESEAAVRMTLFKCPGKGCSEVFSQLHQLLLHRQKCVLVPEKTEERPISVDILSFPKFSRDLSKAEHFARIKVPHNAFICPKESCRKAFYSEADFQEHSKLHGKFNCAFCSKTFSFAPELALHEWGHVGERKKNKLVKCPHCDFSHSQPQPFTLHHLTVHMGISGAAIEHSCAICGIQYTGFSRSQTRVVEHYRELHDLGKEDENSELMKYCGMENCPAYFNLDKSLRPMTRHQELCHATVTKPSQRPKFKCDKCQKVVKDYAMYRNHRQNIHGIQFKLACKEKKCLLTFETEKDVERHFQWQHSKNRKWDSTDCPKCGKTLFSKLCFDRHMALHERKEKEARGEPAPKLCRPFVCELCGKAFKEKNHYQTHLLYHSGPDSWEFACEICGKKCTTKSKLKEHSRTHTKEKPYVCQICGQKYTERGKLRIHVNSKHGDTVRDEPRPFDKTNLTSRKGIKRKWNSEEGPKPDRSGGKSKRKRKT